MIWVPAASLDAETAFWLRNAALISKALAKAQESIEMPDNRFIGPPNRRQSGPPICIARENGVRPLFQIDDRIATLTIPQKILMRKRAIVCPRLSKTMTMNESNARYVRRHHLANRMEKMIGIESQKLNRWHPRILRGEEISLIFLA